MNIKHNAMEPEFKVPMLSRAIFAGLFTGIIVTIANLIYDFVYRGVTHFNPSLFINVSSIIFGSLLVLMLDSFLFLGLTKRLKRGGIIYKTLTLVVAILVIVGLISTHVTGSSVFAGRGGLIFGLIIITGLAGSFLLPYFVKHPDIYI